MSIGAKKVAKSTIRVAHARAWPVIEEFNKVVGAVSGGVTSQGTELTAC
jgi:hypothetical protein